MNYEILSAIGKIKDSQATWEEVDLNTMLLPVVLDRYAEVRVNMKNVFTKQEGGLLLFDLIVELTPQTGTFRDYLDSIGDKALKLNNEKYKINTKGLVYHEAMVNKFKIVPVVSGGIPDDVYDMKHTYKDLFVTKQGINPIDLQKHTLFTVNGYFHQTDASAKGLWITDGYKTMYKRAKRTVGCVSFEHLGALKQIPIKPDMISKINDRTPLLEELIIDLPENAADKTIILIIGGFMHVLDYDVFFRISDSAIKVKLNNLPYLERVHLSNLDLDLDDLGFENKIGSDNVHIEDLYSDETIIRYMTKSYSFVVLLDNVEVFKEITFPQQRMIPNHYLVHELPILPMFGSLGKLEEYVAIKRHDSVYSLLTPNCQSDNRVYNTNWPVKLQSQHPPTNVPNKRWQQPYTFFMNLITMLSKDTA